MTSKKLKPLTFLPLTIGEVIPLGWLKDQLQTQAEGLSGHLDEFWPDIMNSSWFGGSAEGWERVPYWLDGIIPLAFQLNNLRLIQKVEKYVNYILDHQQDTGWFGTTEWAGIEYDPWPNMVLIKALIQYYQIKSELRVIIALIRYFHYLDQKLNTNPLKSWAHFRWMDGIWGIHWIIDHLKCNSSQIADLLINEFPQFSIDTEISLLLKLAQKLYDQGYRWKNHFSNFFYKHYIKYPIGELWYSPNSKNFDNLPTSYIGRILSKAKIKQLERSGKIKKWGLASHVVNNAMGLKAPSIWSRQDEQQCSTEDLFQPISILDKYHGQTTGLFTGDEHLAGRNPTQGTELCAVVEYMFSLETMIAISGQIALIDRLEQICFNALPAAFKPDMWAHQYDQQANQIISKSFKKRYRVYTTNNGDSNLFGLEPNFGCCTANMHQGWPKYLALGLWAKTNDGLTTLGYGPNILQTKINGIAIQIDEDTKYPFEDNICFKFHLKTSCSFALQFRIPAWSNQCSITINGKQIPADQIIADRFTKVTQEWHDQDEILIEFQPKIKIIKRSENRISISRGPLIFVNPVKEKWIKQPNSGIIGKLIKNKAIKVPKQVGDWEVHPDSPWNYGIIDLDNQNIQRTDIDLFPKPQTPFSAEKAPIKIWANVVQIKNWRIQNEIATNPPINPIQQGEKKLTSLIPYGCAHLRITEFPLIE